MGGPIDMVRSNVGLPDSFDGQTFCPVFNACKEDLNSEQSSGSKYGCVTYPAMNLRLLIQLTL